MQLFGIVAESASQPAECIRGTNYHRIAEPVGRRQSLLYGFNRLAFYCLNLNLIEFPDKQLAVFGVFDCLHGGA